MVFYISLLLVCSLLIVIYMVFKAYHDIIDYRTLNLTKTSKLIKPLKLFFISDIHRRKIKVKTLKKISETFDLVIIGGDLTEKGVPMERVEENIKILQSLRAPIYFVWGNNDYEINHCKLSDTLKENEVTILTNDSSTLELDTSTFSFIGSDCCHRGEPDIEQGLKRASGNYTILITHDPYSICEFSEEQMSKIDLVLSGHTHGGQIRVFGLGFYTRGGTSQFMNTTVMVSEGYGYTKLPFRLGTNAECHVITLN
ncbi:metallophosphoesterase [Aquibacillus halophilus]|uniref:Metallophosphoesterase n=1 Tax=Aquibacillus halophilus TaxID=930132 RepID=A0A6A8D9U4_9BACI|nr:metallophosphoesterase [Aquibacillus halophilus]MRH42374.1 metallophosphoesterase [Aquibacillus halophilus]